MKKVLFALALVALVACGKDGGGKKSVESVMLDRSMMMLGERVMSHLHVTVKPSKADAEVEWSSDNPSVAMVNPAGVVSGESCGETYIRVKAGDKEDRCKVVVCQMPEAVDLGLGGVKWASKNIGISSAETSNGEAFTWPVPDSTNITSYYGKREQPMEGASSDHKGIDISCSNGATVVAVVDGIVSQADYSDGYGNKIMIDHGSHISTIYAHLSRFAVSPGDKVTKGQIIGYAGMTGTATDYHLHFAVREEGEYVNPLKYYPGFASDSTVGFSSNKH